MRCAVIMIPAACLAAAGAHDDVIDLFSRAAEALSSSNAARFLEKFDPAMPDYDRFVQGVNALVSQADLASSVEVVKDEGDERHRTVVLDWALEITVDSPAAPTVYRRQDVTCRLERRGKKWKVVALEPVRFFAPP